MLQDEEAENSLYTFLGRVRLNVALDALREVQCTARSADRSILTYALLHDAVAAHHRRSVISDRLCVPILRTYSAKLDDQVSTSQNIQVQYCGNV